MNRDNDHDCENSQGQKGRVFNYLVVEQRNEKKKEERKKKQTNKQINQKESQIG